MDTSRQLTQPILRLGADSSGGLSLPDSNPTPAQLSTPRGVFMRDDLFIVADTGNHRVLIWHGFPTEDGQAADVVLGQPDFYQQSIAGGENCVTNGLHTPTNILVIGNSLYVVDAWHHRILVWDHIPTENYQAPDYVLGQPNLETIEANRGGDVSGNTLYWPYGIAYCGGYFYIADTGNRRVLGWQGLPKPNQPADFILGQDSFTTGLENRGQGTNANTFRWPYALAGNEDVLYVADAGNHRVLGWSPLPTSDRPADIVLGQVDFTNSFEFPYTAQGPQRLRFPYALTLTETGLAVGDMANNRVLLWHDLPQSGCFQAADEVLGQLDFATNGENRWDVVAEDTLCWPYGLHYHAGKLAIADSGNNRVMIWQIGDQA